MNTAGPLISLSKLQMLVYCWQCNRSKSRSMPCRCKVPYNEVVYIQLMESGDFEVQFPEKVDNMMNKNNYVLLVLRTFLFIHSHRRLWLVMICCSSWFDPVPACLYQLHCIFMGWCDRNKGKSIHFAELKCCDWITSSYDALYCDVSWSLHPWALKTTAYHWRLALCLVFHCSTFLQNMAAINY